MVYGDQLAFFAEQFRMFEYFSMTPLPNASYSKRESLGKIKGVFQFVKRGDLLRENDTEADTNVPTIWTRTKLKVGNFIQMEDELYRIIARSLAFVTKRNASLQKSSVVATIDRM